MKGLFSSPVESQSVEIRTVHCSWRTNIDLVTTLGNNNVWVDGKDKRAFPHLKEAPLVICDSGASLWVASYRKGHLTLGLDSCGGPGSPHYEGSESTAGLFRKIQVQKCKR